VRWSEATIEYLRYFRDEPKGQRLIRGWIRRMGRYEPRLRQILSEVGAPEDLVFVAMAESGFNPSRRSQVGAAGMWQFMEGTGRVYGLERSFWIDERLDVERSTYAAAAYLKDLRARFGSWEMALAAYNAGYGLVLKSVGRYNSNNFWALCEIESGLPEATTHYIPKIIAAAVIGRNRRAFAVDHGDLEALPAVEWGDVMVPAKTSLDAVAKLIDEDPALIAELNARYVRGRVPPEGEHPVRVPVAKKTLLQRSQGRLQSEAGTLTTTTVRYGETTAAIAARSGIKEAQLRRLNGIKDNAELERDVVLVVPSRAKSTELTAKDRGERPLAAVPAVVVAPGERLLFFAATRSTTPRGLAEAFGVPWESLVAWNDLDPQARIQPGQILQVIVDASFQADAKGVVVYAPDEVDHVIRGSGPHIDASLARRGLIRRGYKARSGDTMKKIGKRFGLTDGDIARINGVPRQHTPKRGEVFVVYVAKGKTKGTIRPPEPKPTSTVDAAAAIETGEIAEQPESSPEPERRDRPAKASSKSSAGKRSPAKARKPSTPSTSRVPGGKGS
jgi:membrane-bound lytic murein transglycosylase D